MGPQMDDLINGSVGDGGPKRIRGGAMTKPTTGLHEPLKVHLLIDFDGTIATIDTVDSLLSLHAEPKWLEIEAAWLAGKIGSREAMAAQVAVLRAWPDEFDAFVESVAIDHGFMEFSRFCDAARLPVTVVSDGLDVVVRRVLSRHGLTYPVRANKLEQTGADRWSLSFPYAADGCVSGNCKCRAPTEVGELRILIGDGRSDFCAAATVDLCLAKGKLIQHCRDEGIAHVPFRDFHDVTRILTELISGAKTPAALANGLALGKDSSHA
jgi:2-hydroxy-3-keto-5-methylthiopentenyl-1-phosphate phosphatase